MSTFRVLRALAAAALIARLLAAPALGAAPVVEESLSPAEISIGESAELKIKSSGNDTQPPKLPAVPGLEFRVVEQLQGIEPIHGASLITRTTVVRVTPEIVGTFAIPAASPRSQPLMLRVDPANVGSPPPRTGRMGETAASSGIRMTEDDSAFVRLVPERREVYVGESVPIAIELGVRAGAVASLNGLPTLTGNELTLGDLSRQPDRKETVIDGRPFLLLTWHSVLTPVKPGDFPLAIEVPLTVRVSTRPKREAQLEDELGDPFMQRFYGATVPKNVKAASVPLDLIVDPLPAQGRPPEFSGAVGMFAVSSDISSSAAAAGDPLTLRMRVTGSGNFDRVDSPMLEHAERWKTYPPTSSFKASDALGYKGEKVFEQPVIASAPGTQVLPALTFAYFDPMARRYESIRTSPLSVVISPSAADSAPAARGAGAAAGSPAAAVAAQLRPDHTAPASVARSLLPPYLQPRFLAIPSLLSLVFAGTWLRLRGRADSRSRAGSRELRLPETTRQALAQMEAAARAGDGVRFFALARRALQEALALRWHTAPEAVTQAEVDARLDPGDGREEICRLFALADEASYAGRGLEGADLTRWAQVVRHRILGEAS